MASFSAETQQLLVRVLADTSQAQASLRQLQGTLAALGTGEAAQAGSKAGKSYSDAFNKGIKSSRLSDIGAAAVGGGLKFLERTVLATAAAGTILEYQFLKVQDAQAAMARTLEGESAPALARLNEEILELSKTIPLSVTELYRIGEVAGTIGIASSSVAEFTDVVAKMAATTDLGVDAAAMGIGRLLNLFGFVDEKGQAVADQADNIASAMLKLSISQASTDQEILLATERFGALATAMGLLPAQILAISSTAAALGQRPEAIGGSLQRIFQIMNKAVAEGGDKLKEFGRVAGLTGKEFRALVREDPFTAFTTFLEGFGKLSSEEQSLLFGEGKLFPSAVRQQQTLQGLGARVDLLKQAAAAAQQAYEEERLLDEQSAVRFNTLKNNLILLGNAITRGAVAFGSAFDEQLGGAIKRVTDYIIENEDKFTEWGKSVGKAIESIDWERVKQFAQDFFSVFAFGVRTTGDILDHLGPKLTGIIALLGTVNALSGGALPTLAKLTASGIGGVIKLAFEQFVGRGSSPANPLFVADVTGGGLLGGGPSRLRGLLIATGLFAGFASGAVTSGDTPTNTTSPRSPEQLAALSKQQVEYLKTIDEHLKNSEPGSPEYQRWWKNRVALLSGPLGLGNSTFGTKPLGQPTFPFGSDLNAARALKEAATYMADASKDDAVTAEQLQAGAHLLMEAAQKWIDALKPRHREGERGKSIETTVGRKLQRLDIGDPNFAGKLTAYVGRLVDHYTKQPIGTKGHSRGFVLGNVDPVERSLARELRQAIKEGNVPAQDLLVRQLEALDSIPKNDLSPQIERLIETVRRKRLSVRVGGPKVVVTTPRAINRTNVSVTIGKRSIVRSVYTGGGYGPTYVYAGNPGLMYEGPN